MKKIYCVICILFGVGWVYQNANLYYLYNYTELLFAFRLPSWVLYFESILGLLIIYFGIRLCKNKYTLKKTFLIILTLVVTGILIEFISVA